MMFKPVFRITRDIARTLKQIEACRKSVLDLPVDVAMLRSLRETARITSTHFSTKIEGNRLTEPQVREVLRGATVPGRKRDESEVRNYFRALEWLETEAAPGPRITVGTVKHLHGLSFHGRDRGTRFRDGQNIIRDSGSGRIVYLPPEAKDVPHLMRDLVVWIASELKSAVVPPPVVAALAHYQLATIHPWYDGNGRTARLLATLVLQMSGHDLKGIYSLDAYYAQNLQAYYRALTVGPSHNYYEGRVEADLTAFINYFCAGMAEAFENVRAAAVHARTRGSPDQAGLLRKLDPRRRRILELFQLQDTAIALEIASHLGLSPRTVVPLCRVLLADGFLELADASRKNRAYRLGSAFLPLISD